MDMNSNQTTNGTTTNTSSTSSKPPSWVWVLVALASALTIGILLYGAYHFIKRRRARRNQSDAESDAVSRGGGSTRGSRPLWARRRRRSRSQPASRWGWVYPHNNNRTSTGQSSEGLNELGEAPPPYNEDDLEPCLTMDMAEVHAPGLGEGPYRVASRQDRASMGAGVVLAQPGHPEPPAYDFAMNLGSTTSVQAPEPAAVTESRVT